jgi:aspartyl-tRNA(Asn)/glutamyl-tRNA(Gln) amidotransferase subunit A
MDIVQTLLERIETLNGNLIAYLHVSAGHALAAAQAAEAEIGAGGYRGPLHGIPVAYKDIYDVQGMPTTAASKVMAGYVAPEDSTVVARLRQAGAICLGKLNTIEFASGSMDVFGTARNPWNTAMFPGGSSSGSGTALAAHMVPLATGSDTGGSIRNPASFCGIVGLKPTYGRISRAGIIPLSWSLDHAGPMARTVADTALLLQAMAGPDHRDPSAALRPVPDYHAVLRSRKHQARRLGRRGAGTCLPHGAVCGQHAGNDPILNANLQGIVEAVEKATQGRAQGQFDDLGFAEMLLQLGKERRVKPLGVGGHLNGIVADQAV